jgi:phage protein D
MPVRTPRAFIIVGGTSLNCLSVEVSLSKTHKSDTFHTTIPFGALPPGMDENWWSVQNDISVQVQIQTDEFSGAVQLFDGKVDQVGHNFANRILTVQGRDKSAALHDTKTTEKFSNQPPEEVVKAICARHGITADVDQTSVRAGKTFQLDYASMAHRLPEWTMITKLADHFGMNAYMTGGVLYFKPIDETLPVLNVTYQPPTELSYASGNFMRLTTTRNVILGRPVTVKVQSWNHKEKKAYSSEKTEPGEGDPLIYNYNEPSMTGDQVEKLADKRLAENTSHELNFSLDMPGDPSVTPRLDMQLSGTGTAYDQQHEIKTVEHSLSQDGGYRMTVSAKSKSKKRGGKGG